MADQTLGSWSINDWPQKNAEITIGAIGTPLIAIVPLRDVSINEQKANAHLIAAAPDLLESLKNIWKAEFGSEKFNDSVKGTYWETAFKAIAKAEGRPL